jgi:hypothetical protein
MASTEYPQNELGPKGDGEYRDVQGADSTCGPRASSLDGKRQVVVSGLEVGAYRIQEPPHDRLSEAGPRAQHRTVDRCGRPGLVARIERGAGRDRPAGDGECRLSVDASAIQDGEGFVP